MFEDLVVDVEAVAEGARDAVVVGGVLDQEPGFPCGGAQDGEGGE